MQFWYENETLFNKNHIKRQILNIVFNYLFKLLIKQKGELETDLVQLFLLKLFLNPNDIEFSISPFV